MKKKRKSLIVVLAPLLGLYACGGLLNSGMPARQYYLLEPLEAASGNAGGGGPELAVTVTAVPGLDTDRILSLNTDARLDRLSNARWTDHQPEVIASVARRSLASTGNFAQVREGPDAHGDAWSLQLEIQAFFGIQDAGGKTRTVRIRMEGLIECNGDHSVFGLADDAPVGQQSLSTIVAAHQRVLDGAMRQMIDAISANCQLET